jgi:hypothetical protein
MADLDILKALRDPGLTIQALPEPSTMTSANQMVPVHGRRMSGSEEWIDDFELLKDLQDSEPNIHVLTEPLPTTTTTPQQNHICADHADSSYRATVMKLTAIENWIELLETPFKSCIFLAKGNWQARQAATAISIARGRKTCVLSEKTCWACVAEQHQGVAQCDQVVTFIA